MWLLIISLKNLARSSMQSNSKGLISQNGGALFRALAQIQILWR
jgi:hypothetical protein